MCHYRLNEFFTFKHPFFSIAPEVRNTLCPKIPVIVDVTDNIELDQLTRKLQNNGYENVIYLTSNITESNGNDIIYFPAWLYSSSLVYSQLHRVEILSKRNYLVSCLNRNCFPHKIYTYLQFLKREYISKSAVSFSNSYCVDAQLTPLDFSKSPFVDDLPKDIIDEIVGKGSYLPDIDFSFLTESVLLKIIDNSYDGLYRDFDKLPKIFKTENVCLKVCIKNPENIPEIPYRYLQDPLFVEKVIMERVEALEYFQNNSTFIPDDAYLRILEKHYILLGNIPSHLITEEIAEKSVMQDAYCYLMLKEEMQTSNLANIAVEKEPKLIYVMGKHSEESWYKDIKDNLDQLHEKNSTSQKPIQANIPQDTDVEIPDRSFSKEEYFEKHKVLIENLRCFLESTWNQKNILNHQI